MTEPKKEDKTDYFQKLIWAWQVFQVHGIATHTESTKIGKRLGRYIRANGYDVEQTGFRTFDVKREDDSTSSV